MRRLREAGSRGGSFFQKKDFPYRYAFTAVHGFGLSGRSQVDDDFIVAKPESAICLQKIMANFAISASRLYFRAENG